jgi:hypothetical protein
MSKKTYFQYQKESMLPVYISADLTQFEPSLVEFLAKMKFSRLVDKEETEAIEAIKKNNLARVLHMSEATYTVAKQIQNIAESDRYGAESIVAQYGYRVYRYKGLGLMVYSHAAKEWELGTYKDFGSHELLNASKMIINRFLTWALAPQGILGIWGVPADDAIVAQRAVDSKNEAVFIDINGLRMFSQDGMKKLRASFKILRLDPTLRGRNIKMTSEELISFISAHCSYFDTAGLSVPVRQMVQTLSKIGEGLIHPQESFRPRTDLSL